VWVAESGAHEGYSDWDAEGHAAWDVDDRIAYDCAATRSKTKWSAD